MARREGDVQTPVAGSACNLEQKYGQLGPIRNQYQSIHYGVRMKLYTMRTVSINDGEQTAEQLHEL